MCFAHELLTSSAWALHSHWSVDVQPGGPVRCRTQVQMLLQNHSLFTAFPQPDSWESILYINLFLGYWTHRGKIWGIWSHVFSCCYVAIFLFAIFCSCILNCTAVTLPVNRIFFFFSWYLSEQIWGSENKILWGARCSLGTLNCYHFPLSMLFTVFIMDLLKWININ